MQDRPAVELRGIKKCFGEVKANDDLTLTAYRGEIHAILGENGCGKSTLMNILSGLYAPDGGEIRINGRAVSFASPREAAAMGIGMIHQHFKLVEALTAWENIISVAHKGVFLSRKKAVAQVNTLCDRYGLRLSPEKLVADMTIAEKQTVEIVKALFAKADILILDEPTAVLTAQETKRLFQILREMKAQGHVIIIITHKLNEVMEISDRVTVLNKGKDVATALTSGVEARMLAELMVGHQINITAPFIATDDAMKKPVLEISDLRMLSSSGRVKLNIPGLIIHSGEIVGIAGVADSGQRQLCESIVGLRKGKISGSIKLGGRELSRMSPRGMRRRDVQIGYVPEDRLGMGLAGGLSIVENTVLRSYNEKKGLMMDGRGGRRQAQALVKDYQVSTPRLDIPVRLLSGGNIQKILLGREISRGADLLITAYPVRGLDIGATDYIYQKMNEEKLKGVAQLLIAEDLDTLLGICDRIAVLCDGELMTTVNAKETTKDELGLYMSGMREEDVKAC